MNHLGEKIRKYRTSLKMTQADFADRLDVTGAAISAYENGTRLPSYDVLVKIANILNVTTDELLGRSKLEKESLDVTELTNDQRRNLSEMVEIYRQFNRTCEVLSDETRKRAEQFISSGFLK